MPINLFDVQNRYASKTGKFEGLLERYDFENEKKPSSTSWATIVALNVIKDFIIV